MSDYQKRMGFYLKDGIKHHVEVVLIGKIKQDSNEEFARIKFSENENSILVPASTISNISWVVVIGE